jgi:adenylate kinase
MFREALAQGTPLGLEAKGYMDRGELVPDAVTVAMVMERLNREDCRGGAILDGFPRTLVQAEALDAALKETGRHVDQAVYLAVPREELLRRLSGRWLCRSCGASYHGVFNPPRIESRCDRCGGELYQRADDTRETAERRLEVYFAQTEPLIDYYRAQGVLEEIDGSVGIEEVSRAALGALKQVRARIG